MRRPASLAAAALLAAGCAALPTDYPREASVAATDTGATILGRAAARLAPAAPGLSAVRLLERGTDAFAARLALAEVAERTLDVQYYIWHRDTTGRLLAEALLRAADRGVRVRLLLDDIGTAADDATLLLLDGHAAIEVRLFNPLANRAARNLSMLGSFERANRRMHNKSFTADNQLTVLGGRNIGDEYFGARQDVAFADLDVLGAGPVAREVSRSFDAYWNAPATYPIAALAAGARGRDLAALRSELAAFADSQRDGPYAASLRDSGLVRHLRDGDLALAPARVRLLADDPAKAAGEAEASGTVLGQMLPEFDDLRQDLLIVSPYFVPGEEGVKRLARLRERGVRVRVLTNSLAATDVPAVHAGYAKYRRALLEAGIELHEVRAAARPAHDAGGKPEGSGLTGSSRASLHAKTLVFDCRDLFVGSMNVDPRSVFTNTEIGAMIEAPDLAASVCDRLGRGMPSTAYAVKLRAQGGLEWVSGAERLDTEPASGWRRFQAWFFSLMPIEPLL